MTGRHYWTVLIAGAALGALVWSIGSGDGFASGGTAGRLSASRRDVAARRLRAPALLAAPVAHDGDNRMADESDYEVELVRAGVVKTGAVWSVVPLEGSVLVGAGEEVTVLDVSDTSTPAVISSIRVGGSVVDMALHGSDLFVAIQPGGWQVIDVHDLAAMVITDAIKPYVPANANGLAVEIRDGVGYFVETQHVAVASLADGGSPVVLGSMTSEAIVSNYTIDVEDAPGTLYVVCKENIVVVDVRDAASPVEALRIPTTGIRNWNGMTTRGDRAYVGAQMAGLVVFDISNPQEPVEVAALAPTSFVPYRDPDTVGSLLLVPAGTDGLHVFDITEKDEPSWTASLPTAGNAWRVEATSQDSPVFLCDVGIGLDIIDVSSPRNPVMTASVEWPRSFSATHVRGATIFGYAGNGRVLAYDASDPGAPHLVGRVSVDAGEGGTGVAWVDDTIVIVSGETDELLIVDAKDPSSMRLVTSVLVPGATGSVSECDGYAAVATRPGFAFVDVSDLHQPRIVGTYRGGGPERVEMGRRVVCEAGIAYAEVASDLYRFVALDIRDPARIEVGGGIRVDVDGFGLAAHGLAAVECNLIVGTDTKLVFVDTADFRALKVRPWEGNHPGVQAMAAQGDVVVMGAEMASPRLTVWDVRFPDEPQLVGSADTYMDDGSDRAWYSFGDLAIDADLVVGAAGDLVIWRVVKTAPGESTPTPIAALPSPTPTPTRVPTQTTVPIMVPVALRGS